MRYPIVIHKDEGSCYGVAIPDLPGCFSAGDTFEEAIANSHEAICCHIEAILMDEDCIPEPMPMQTHLDSGYYDDRIWALVDVDLSKVCVETKRIEIELPSPILAMIDEFAARERSRARNPERARLYAARTSDWASSAIASTSVYAPLPFAFAPCERIGAFRPRGISGRTTECV